MRSTLVLPTALAAASGIWAMIAALRMGAWLQQHGVKVNWLWYRLTMPWYVHLYHKMTKEREGRAGPLFKQFVVAINLALLLAVVVLVTLALNDE